MIITRKAVADRIAAYLHHQITAAELADWAETQMMEAEFEEAHLAQIRDVIARLGVADVRAFGLTWEDCEPMLRLLGYSVRIEIGVA